MKLRTLQLLAPAAGCNCDICPFFTMNPDAVEPICSGCNSDCTYCGCSRSTAPHHNGCATCPIRCGSRTDIADWMRAVGGTLTFDDITIPNHAPSDLPRFIPQVDGHDVATFDEGLHWPAYAIGLRRVFSPATHRIVPRFEARTAHQVLGLADNQRAVLVGYGTDPLVEAFWTRRHDGLIDTIAAQRWDLVLTPNWSMYGNQPRAEHLINFRRNLLAASELAAAGIPAVPNIYWYRLEDLDRYLRWAHDTAPTAVAINLQTFRTAADWEVMALPGLTYLAHGLPEGCELIATGTSRPARIAVLRELFGSRLRLIAQSPQQYARHGAVMTSDGRRDLHARVTDAFASNVRYYASLLEPDPRPDDQPERDCEEVA